MRFSRRRVAGLPASWLAGKILNMKTTLDLPQELVKRLKMRAVRDGRKLKDLAAELLFDGLKKTKHSKHERRVRIVRDKRGFPIIQGRRAAPRGQELTPERIAEIMIDQEAEWARDPR
jgi:plasmid stability protein